MKKPTGGRPQTGSFDKRTLIRGHSFFSGWDDKIIDQLVPHAIMRKVKKGTVLFRKGDVGTNLYAVCAGAVKVSASSDQGKDAVFSLIVPGEIFGEIAFLDGGQRTADAVMNEDGELMVIERRELIPLLHEYPEVAIKLIEILCKRLRRTSLQVEDIVFFDVRVRLAKALLTLYRQAGAGAATKFIPVTQRELSQMVGATREYTNRELQDWQRRKWLKLKRAGVAILAPQELERLIPDAAK
jgi:CRP/FNR family transcriptional regulator, cyclic AMP receptor protein